MTKLNIKLKGKVFKSGIEELAKLVDDDSLTYLGIININRNYYVNPRTGEQIEMEKGLNGMRTFDVDIAATENVRKELGYSDGGFNELFSGNSALDLAHRFIDRIEGYRGTFYIANIDGDLINNLNGELYNVPNPDVLGEENESRL